MLRVLKFACTRKKGLQSYVCFSVLDYVLLSILLSDPINQVTATKMPTLDDIVASSKDKSKQHLQEALLELLKGNPDILDSVTKSTTRIHSDVVSVFFNRMHSSSRRFIFQGNCKIILDIIYFQRDIIHTCIFALLNPVHLG